MKMQRAGNGMRVSGGYYGTREHIVSPVVRLTCCCCGAATRGRQWWNRDTGFGLCPECIALCSQRETPESFQRLYGDEGVHYFRSGNACLCGVPIEPWAAGCGDCVASHS